MNVLYRRVGLEAMGEEITEEKLAAEFNQPAVIRGFKELSQEPYQEVLAMLDATPDGTPGENEPVFPQAPPGGFTGEYAGEAISEEHAQMLGEAHPVSCIDCHDPETLQIRVTRPGFLLGVAELAAGEGAVPHLRSPMENVNSACQTCHNVPEAELRARVGAIQSRTVAQTERAGEAMTAMLDAIMEAKAGGAGDADLEEVLALQRKAMWRLDYISSENSKGFHADQESARLLAESIDYSRQAQAQAAALRLRAPAAPSTETLPTEPVQGATPTEQAPVRSE